MEDLNTITLVCRLAADPDLRSLASGTSVCSLRVAYNVSKKDGATGEWSDVGHFVNVTVWGKQGESVARNLTKGQRIAIKGRLEHRTWQDQNGNNREAHQIVADRVQYLTPKAETTNGGGGFEPRQQSAPATPPATPQVQTQAPLPADDDIPF